MEKIKKRIANLKVAGKLRVYRETVLVMTLCLVLVARNSLLTCAHKRTHFQGLFAKRKNCSSTSQCYCKQLFLPEDIF